MFPFGGARQIRSRGARVQKGGRSERWMHRLGGCCAACALWLAVGCERSGASAAASSTSSSAVLQPGQCVKPWSDVAAPVASRPAACPADPEGNLDLGTIEITFSDATGRPSIVAEHALTEKAKERGLMYRTEMPDGAGMLFTWDDDKPRRFWMRNTCLPLDMLFIDSKGTIVSILEQVPTLNTAPRPSGCPARHVLEVNAGWAREHGVRPGQKVQIGS
jgi:uncharacterized protein